MVSLTNHLVGVSPWGDTRPTVAGDDPYANRLKAAIDQSGMSVREIARRLSEKTGNPIEDERPAIYRYLKETEPAPDRAAFLAEILSAPELEEVTPLAEKRRGRLAALEDEVAALRATHDSDLRGVLARLAALEANQGRGAQPEAQPSSEENP